VKIHAFGVNPVDAKYIIGDKLPETWMEWSARRVHGHTPGFDFSGTVVVAPSSSPYKVGDEVFGLAADPSKIMTQYQKGSFAEYAAPPLDQIALKPSNLTHVEAAALPLVGTTAVQAFQEHYLSPGQRVLIIGASGGVGHVATQVASRLGAIVVGVCSGSNADFVVSCGASAVLDYRQGDIFECIKTEATTNGKFDLVLDCVNSADSRDSAASYRLRILQMKDDVMNKSPSSNKHNYVVLGGQTKEWMQAGLKRFTRINAFAKDFELFWIKMPGSAPALNVIKDLCETKRMKPKVERSLAFTEDNARTIFESLRGRRTVGKAVIKVVE